MAKVIPGEQGVLDYIDQRLEFLLNETEEVEENIQSSLRRIEEEKKILKEYNKEIQYLNKLKKIL